MRRHRNMEPHPQDTGHRACAWLQTAPRAETETGPALCNREEKEKTSFPLSGKEGNVAVSLLQVEGIWVKIKKKRGAWVAQSVKCPTSAQVTILQLVGSSPTSGPVLTAQNPEPASDSVSPSLSLPGLCSVPQR